MFYFIWAYFVRTLKLSGKNSTIGDKQHRVAMACLLMRRVEAKLFEWWLELITVDASLSCCLHVALK